MKFRIIMFLCLFALGWFAGAQQEPIALEISAMGIGKPNPDEPNPAACKLMARRAAQLDAARNLLARIKNTMAAENPFVDQQVEGFIAGIRYGDPVVLEDGTVQVEAFLSVDNLLRNYVALAMELGECHKTIEANGALLEERQVTIVRLSREIEEGIQRLAQKEAEFEALQKECEIKCREKEQAWQVRIQELEQKLACAEEKLKSAEDDTEKILALQKMADEKEAVISQLQAELGRHRMALSDAGEKLRTLEARYAEQSKALDAFEKERSGGLQPYIAALEEKIRINQALQEKMEERWAKEVGDLEGNLVHEREKMRILEQQNQKLEEHSRKTLDVLARINQELTDLWLKYEALVQDSQGKEAEMAWLEEVRLHDQKQLQQARKAAEDWENRYNRLWDAYAKLLQKTESGSDPETIGRIEEILKRIYIEQKSLKKDVSNIKEWLLPDEDEE